MVRPSFNSFWLLILVSILILGLVSSEPRGRGRKNKIKESLNKTHVVENTREGKVFSLFNIVQFKNDGCRSTDSSSGANNRRNGTCFTRSECVAKGGRASGSCAAGFGVCCVFLVTTSGGTVNQNCSYIQNPGFPAAYADTSSISYTIRKCSNSVCSLRLDFETFSLLGTAVASLTGFERTGGVCQDTFIVSSTATSNIPMICGQNTGQHIYVDIGSATGDTATLNFRMFSGAATNRMWDIKVTQLPCGTNYGPPSGCLQYSTGLTGRFTTFNFIPTNDNHLANQQYSHCIRQESGFCCVQYTLCTDVMSMSLGVITENPAMLLSKVDTECTGDYVGIVGSTSECNQGSGPDVTSMYCDTALNPITASVNSVSVCDCTAPFAIDIFTDALPDVAVDPLPDAVANRGVCLNWMQVACQ